jgi:hypothetical protein
MASATVMIPVKEMDDFLAHPIRAFEIGEASTIVLEILPHSFHIFNIRLHGDIFRLYIPSRLSTPSLVVIDKAKCVGQAIQIGK